MSLLLADLIQAQVTYTWNGGTFASISPSVPPANTIAFSDTLVIATTAQHDFNATSWTNQGTVNWTDGILRSGGGATLTNSALWTDAASGSLNNAFGGGWTFSNAAAGTYSKTGAGTTRFLGGVSFHNAGLVQVTKGTLSIEGGGALNGGTISADAGATVDLGSNFTATGTVTFAGAGAVRLTGGTLSGTATLQGALTWLAGDFNGAGTTTFGKTALLTLASVGAHDFNQRTLVNQGTVNWTAGSIRAGGSAVFTNQATFNDTASAVMNNDYGGGWTFVNTASGIYNKSSMGTTVVGAGVAFDNAGLVQVTGGTLSLQGGGNLTGGTITAGAGAFVDLASSFVVNGNATFASSDGGAVRFTAGTLSGTPTLLGTLEWTSGNFNGSGTTTFGAGAVISIASGAQHDFNQRTLVNLGTVNWLGGPIRAGGSAAFMNQALFHDDASAVMNNDYGGGWSFVNTAAGTYNKTGAGTTVIAAGVAFKNAGTVNVTNGTLSLQGGGDLAGGTLSAGTGAFIDLASSLIANGTVHFAQAGTGAVRLTGGTFSGASTFQGPLSWVDGNFNGVGTTTFGSSATISIVSGSQHDFNQRNLLNQGTVDWIDGVLRAGGGAVFHNQSVFNDTASDRMNNDYGGGWSFLNPAGGVYQKTGIGTTTLSPGVALNNTGLVSVTQGTLLLQGGGTLTSGTFHTGNGAFIDIASSILINGTAHFTAAGTGATRFTGGTINGVATLEGPLQWWGGNFNGGGLTTFGSTSAVTITGAVSHDFNQRALVNNGTATWNDGSLRAGGGASFTNHGVFVAAAANVMNSDYGGGWTFLNAATGVFQHDIVGTTTVGPGVGLNNAGRLLLSRGTLVLQGSATFAGPSALEFKLAGPIAGTDFGLLQVSSALALNGGLNVEISSGFAVLVDGSNTFALLTASSLNGSFSNILNGARLMTFDGAGSFQVNYGTGSAFAPNAVVLSHFVPVPEPSTWMLLLLGSGATLVRLWRRKRAGPS